MGHATSRPPLSQRLYSGSVTARDDVLRAARELSVSSSDGTFTLEEVLDYLRSVGTRYKPATIRTHVTSRMCANAPAHHAVTYRDLVRVGEARYQLNRDP